MEYTPEQIKEVEDIVTKVITTGTVTHEDKNKVENALEYISGQSWKGRCFTCNSHNVSAILKGFYEKLQNEKVKKVQETITVKVTDVPTLTNTPTKVEDHAIGLPTSTGSTPIPKTEIKRTKKKYT